MCSFCFLRDFSSEISTHESMMIFWPFEDTLVWSWNVSQWAEDTSLINSWNIFFILFGRLFWFDWDFLNGFYWNFVLFWIWEFVKLAIIPHSNFLPILRSCLQLLYYKSKIVYFISCPNHKRLITFFKEDAINFCTVIFFAVQPVMQFSVDFILPVSSFFPATKKHFS